jgi:hypothetical protein
MVLTDLEDLGKEINPGVLELALKEAAQEVGWKMEDGTKMGTNFRLKGEMPFTGMTITLGKRIEGKIKDVIYYSGLRYGNSSEETRKNYFDKVRGKIRTKWRYQ